MQGAATVAPCETIARVGVPASLAPTRPSDIRLSRALGTTPGFWLGLQADYDTEEAEKLLADALPHIVHLAA